SWAADTGHIKIRYTPKTMRDWQEEKGLRSAFVHPMAFKGEYSVTMRGTLAAGDNLMLLFDAVGDAVGVADFGGGNRQGFAPVRLLRRTGNQERELLDRKTLYGGLREGPYAAMLRVTSTRLQVYVDDLRRPLVEAPREKGPFG